ncbi:LapA family protein [Helicobacter pametensis]|uniref:LapA family protein n=1 Tax=Helicobacter pametensis TaxID=95149 RepID=UPI000485EE1E|nr:LapA family protein [Helicobacter pametensis]
MRHYFLFFFIFTLLIGGILYVFHPSDISLSLFQHTLSFPLSLWVILVLFAFFIGSLFFFASDWVKKFWFERHLKKDLETLIQQISNQLLSKHSTSYTFKTQSFQTLSKILSKAQLSPILGTPPSQENRIDQLFSELEELEKGNVLKDVYEPNSHAWEKNLHNKINSDPKFALKVIEENYPQNLKEYALNTLLSQDNLQEKTIQKLIKKDFDSKHTAKIIEFFLQKGYRLGQEDFANLLYKVDAPYILGLLKLFKSQFDPDFCISLFRKLAQDSKFHQAYAYLLLDYSMFDQAKEFIFEHENLMLPKAYIRLKEEGEDYPLELFFH